MSAQFVVARFPSDTHRAAIDWLRAVDDIVSVHGGDLIVATRGEPPSGAVAGWRLMSDNHREIARGAALFASERLAQAHAVRVRENVAGLAVHAAVEPRLRTTGWFATHDDELVMVGARRYENRSVARNAGALALRLIAAMAVPPGSIGVTPAGLTR
ncbi:hypothetical protein [Microbacterium sp. SORGH_AS_0888]|uniref:hypothetical protein n=1 Tax=Microbacterium sp. SORGH_AS_0888 TaxID=3041791 RepID=UPI0027843A34|nr:hypothetical protein [Microbacterium sp. SORGH_AS_0888]MDQ1129045.1 hypothetical protein [Microbacterium sp. SORGH_AS_0888]